MFRFGQALLLEIKLAEIRQANRGVFVFLAHRGAKHSQRFFQEFGGIGIKLLLDANVGKIHPGEPEFEMSRLQFDSTNTQSLVGVLCRAVVMSQIQMGNSEVGKAPRLLRMIRA